MPASFMGGRYFGRFSTSETQAKTSFAGAATVSFCSYSCMPSPPVLDPGRFVRERGPLGAEKGPEPREPVAHPLPDLGPGDLSYLLPEREQERADAHGVEPGRVELRLELA